MLNKDIIKKIKKEIDLNKNREIKLSVGYCFKVFTFSLNVFIKDSDSCFNSSILDIQFKSLDSAKKFYLDSLKENIVFNLNGCSQLKEVVLK